ncbi:MAG: ribosome silencing factor [Acaryochloridaceae cyanobacterium SU_2_1]|nr:ribosome silencing factor [Acaryochloridaceae cyanobacterium SU_2_1]
MSSDTQQNNSHHRNSALQEPSLQLALCLAQAAADRKGGELVVLDVAEMSYLADYFVIVSGFSRTQTRAIAESMLEVAQHDCDRLPRRQEGKAEGSWILLDYGDVIAHVFMPEQREFYDLEAFWGHADQLELPSLLPNSPPTHP